MARALKNIVVALVISVFFLTPAQDASAQPDMWRNPEGDEDWDDVLSLYASLCDSCFMLKPLIASGVPVSKGYAEGLVSRFISLNRKLREAMPELTPEEQGTFIRITEKFLELPGDGKVRGQTDEGLPPVDCPSDSLRNEIPLKINPLSTPPRQPDQVARENAERRRHTYHTTKTAFGIQAIFSVPDPSFGVMMSARRDRWGGYCKFSSDFKSSNYSYSWPSDQEFPEGAGFNMEGGKRKTSTEITAGLLTAVTGWLSVYAGAGYGKKAELKTLTQDGSRSLTILTKINAGTVAEAGLKYNLGYITFSTGISTISFRTVSASFGIGVNF